MPFPIPGDLLDTEIKPVSHVSADRFFTSEPPGKTLICVRYDYLYARVDKARKKMQTQLPPPEGRVRIVLCHFLC